MPAGRLSLLMRMQNVCRGFYGCRIPLKTVPQVALAHLCRLISDSGVAVVVRSVSLPDASARAVIGETHLFVIQ